MVVVKLVKSFLNEDKSSKLWHLITKCPVFHMSFLPPFSVFPLSFHKFASSLYLSVYPSFAIFTIQVCQLPCRSELGQMVTSKSVYLHAGPNKTSRCLQNCSSPPVTMIPKQALQEEKGKESTRRVRLAPKERKEFVFSHWNARYYMLLVTAKPDFI